VFPLAGVDAEQWFAGLLVRDFGLEATNPFLVQDLFSFVGAMCFQLGVFGFF